MHFALHHEAKEDNDDIISDDEIEAEWLARKIEEIHANGVDGLKEVNYNDIAILVKSQTILPAYERALLQHGIPYSSEKIKDFFDEGLINDIYSFIRICVYKNDFPRNVTASRRIYPRRTENIRGKVRRCKRDELF